MNPPPALFGAMSRERKPFTYTPGGLDLSEIKSERMAQRLIRNAMNQGVPETPANSLKSPPATGIPTAIPNFNCLPVQVFPSFQLPANPKSLLRTRSNPDGSRETQKQYRPFNENIETNVNKHDINRFSYPNGHERLETNSMHPKQNTAGNYCTLPKTNKNSFCNDAIIYEKPYTFENNDCEIKDTVQKESNMLAFRNSENIKSDSIDYNTINNEQNANKEENDFGDTSETKKQQEETTVTKSSTKTENKEETTVTKSSTKTENDVHSQNGDMETAIVVKLPTKKSAAKTETKVEVVQKSLPDGSVQEIKTTTTRTTVDGKTEIATKTETKTISKEETDEETYEEEEIEDEKNSTTENETIVRESSKQNEEIIKQEEKSETSTTTTKKVVVIQSDAHESEEEAEEVDEEEEVEEEEEDVDQNVEEVVVIKKQDTAKSVSDDSEEKEIKKEEVQNEVDNQSEEECEVEEEEDQEVNEIESKDKDLSGGEDEEEEKNESEEKCENGEVENDEEEKKEPVSPGDDTNKENTDTADLNTTTTASSNNVEETVKTETKSEEKIIPIKTESKPIRTEVLREPNVPLEKVEEVEIKPIGAPAQEIITKSTKEIISTTTDNPSAHSTETKYNVIENIVTVNRTTKTLDHAYELPGEYTIPVVKTSLIPESSGILPPPPPIFNRTYQTSYSKEPTTERRHSLLLERLSVERQLPTSNIYQTDNTNYTNHTYDARQLGGEPQSEIVIENNVKPSMVNKNQQWYSRKDSYDYATTGSSIPCQQWNQPQTQPQPQTPTQYQPQPQYQSQPQSQYHSQPQYQPQSQAQYHSQYEYTPQGQSYHQSINQQTQYSPQPQSQPAFNDTYKSSIQNNYSQNTYSSYTPKPSWVNSTVDPKPTSLSNQYSYESESYQKSTQNQNSYVPPPWEQDSGYTNNFSQNTYQPQTPTTPLPKPTPSWKAPTNKFSKPTTSYVPPAPNQSFVKPVSATDPPKISGRKTYYSEYERRYITVPESTYIPTETKFQAQPDASPKYYYDQNEPAETVEPQWRKELREFTEKTQTSSHTTETSVRPPWEEDPKYVTSSEQMNTRTWSQTLRPRSFRERSIESDYTTTTTTAREWSKSNSLGRGRPQSSYVNNLKRIPERTRGVSVDRYNPNVYQSPIMGEHPPVQSQTLDPTIHPKPHYQHNPNIPAYHNRASAEPREQPAYRQPKWDSHAPPVQSRSFKYLQWITGTED